MDVPCSEQALSLFFHQYVSQGNGETPGFNDFLPLFYQQAHSNSCLKHCVAATAYASLANQSKSMDLSRKAREIYGTALSSVNAALAHPVESVKDETLCALFILSIFENISGQQLHIFGVHGSGMDRLLHFRGPRRLATTNRQRISKAVGAYLLIRNLSLRRWPLPHEEIWFGDVNYPEPYRLAMLNASRICHVRADAEDLLTSIGSASSDDRGTSLQRNCDALTRLVAEMQAITSNHWLWPQNAPDSWGYVSVGSPLAGIELGLPPDNAIHIYHSLWAANFWNWSRSSCILLQLSLLKCLKELSSISGKLPNDNSPTKNAQMIIKTMIRDICASIPFIMVDIDSQGNIVKAQQTEAPVGQNMAQLWLLWHFHVSLASCHVVPY
jgi:hypothetical protein